MTLKEAAQIYVDLIKLDEKIGSDDNLAKEEISILRSKYHEIFMEILRRENIPFSDRFEATNIAFSEAKE